MKAFELIQVGLTKEGKPFSIPRFHTLIAAASGAGKTETARKIVSTLAKLIPELRVLIFDVKSTGRDWQGYGVDIPIYVETATDSRFLRDLIETQEKRKIDWFFYELHMACQGAATWEQVLANLRKRYCKYKDRNQMKEEKLGTLMIYMEALVSELGKGEVTSTFDLSNRISVVPINYREDAFKHLVVFSYLTAIRKNQVRNVLVVCDEMSSLAPSQAGTGCKRVVEQLFKQGRAAENFGLAIDQEITGISPSVRRQCWNWILGMQTDVSAQERTISQIPGKKLNLDDISTLGVGWWWAVIRTPSSTEVEKFYLIPEGVDIEVGRKIVSGEIKVEDIMHGLHITEEEDMEELNRLKSELASSQEKIRELEKKFEETTVSLREAISQLPASGVSIGEVDARIKQHFATLDNRCITIIDVDTEIRKRVKNEVLDRLIFKLQHLTEPAKKAAWWLHQKQISSIKELYNFVYDKTEVAGRIPANFYANVVTPLQDALLARRDGNNLTWVFKEKVNELLGNLAEEDMERTPKYLASFLL